MAWYLITFLMGYFTGIIVAAILAGVDDGI
jgi:hypothetical protein